MLDRLRNSDVQKRKKLISLIKEASSLLDDVRQTERVVAKQLEQEAETRHYRETMQLFLSMLHVDECPVVVAGKEKSIPVRLMNSLTKTHV